MKRIEKIKALQQAFSTSTSQPLQKIKGRLKCCLNLSDGTITILEGLKNFEGQKLNKAKFDNVTEGLEIHTIINLGKGINPNE